MNVVEDRKEEAARISPFVRLNDEGAGVVVNESLARAYWGESSPLGRSLVVRRDRYQVIGVVRDVRTVAPDRVEPCVYQALPRTRIPRVPARRAVRLDPSHALRQE